MKQISIISHILALVWGLWLCQASMALVCQASSLLDSISSQDALLVAGPDGHINYKQNETRKYAPASTLKLLTALAAIHHLGKSYRFRTDFYLDEKNNLKIKGYGDPLLVSEVWQEIAKALSARLKGCKDLILDNSHFVRDIRIPGVGHSTDPYDAPVGAICANFNTVFFKKDKAGNIISAEPQTPMTPLALKNIRSLGLKGGRYTLTHDSSEAACYAGELLVHFLRETGTDFEGEIRTGVVDPEDRLLYTYRSVFTLEEGLQRMLEFSNNFMANQILLALGAHVHGAPATLSKGITVVSSYAKGVLGLNDIRVVEGSGISKKNRLSPLDMLGVLNAFEPYRGLLTRKGNVIYKSGTLKGLRRRAGYIETGAGRPCHFVIFLNSPHPDIDALTVHLAKSLDN